MINGVANGTVDLDKARTATKLAAQVNESFYSEVKIARTMLESKQEVAELGNLRVGNKADDQ